MGFGDFDWICVRSPLPLCSLVGPVSSLTGSTGIDATCYARSVELANTIIFEAATDFMHILALTMTAIMIIHVRSKFTAVGEFASSFGLNQHCHRHPLCRNGRRSLTIVFPQGARRSYYSSTSTLR